MSDYISREAFIRQLQEKYEYLPKEVFFPGMKIALEIARELPAADVREVKKASWYGEADGYADGELVYDMWSCPICGKRFEEWDEKPNWNFCPNCGTDMREEQK